MKPWKFAKSFCENGGGILAQPKSTSNIQTVLEAINLQAGSQAARKFWLGGQQSLQIGDNIIMSQNYPSDYPNNYDEVYIQY